MDLKKYIESGILEQYVLGTLSPEEVKGVENTMSQYPEIRAEVMAIEDAMEDYAKAHAVKAPPGLEKLILEKIDQNNFTDSNSTNQQNKNTKAAQKTTTSKLLPILLVVLALALLSALYNMFTSNTSLKSLMLKHDKLEQEFTTLKSDCETLRAAASDSDKYLAFVQDRNTKPIVMEGTDNAKEALSTVYWNPTKKKSYLRTITMPEVPTDKQYQLWAIVDGKPVDMGVFDVAISANDFIEIPHIEGAQAFAVTLEKKGGVPSPTMDQMYVLGENS